MNRYEIYEQVPEFLDHTYVIICNIINGCCMKLNFNKAVIRVNL